MLKFSQLWCVITCIKYCQPGKPTKALVSRLFNGDRQHLLDWQLLVSSPLPSGVKLIQSDLAAQLNKNIHQRVNYLAWPMALGYKVILRQTIPRVYRLLPLNWFEHLESAELTPLCLSFFEKNLHGFLASCYHAKRIISEHWRKQGVEISPMKVILTHLHSK